MTLIEKRALEFAARRMRDDEQASREAYHKRALREAALAGEQLKARRQIDHAQLFDEPPRRITIE